MATHTNTPRRLVAILSIAALAVTASACGSDEESSSRTRNAALLAGTACTKVGSTKKAGGVTNVCAKAAPSPLWYEVSKSKGKSVKCKSPGAVKMLGGVAWVCSGSTKKASWVSTRPLPMMILQGPTDAISTAVEAPAQPATDQVALVTSTDSTTTSVVTTSTTLSPPTSAPKTSTTGAISPTTSAPKTSTTVTPTPTVSPVTSAPTIKTCAAGGKCSVGDVGPGGGKVFFVSTTGFRVTATGETAYYLEAASNSSTRALVWCDVTSSTIAGADGTTIGSGAQNTIDMAKACKSGVGKTVSDFESGGKTDWFLPSKAEQNEFCKFMNSAPTGNTSVICSGGSLRNDFTYGSYWTSSESNATEAWKQPLGSGVQWAYSKAYVAFIYVPIRAF